MITATNEENNNMKDIIKIEHASVRRDGKYILDDVSLSIKEGEKLAIIGPNGAGKSTLVDVIARRTYPLAKDEYKNEILGKERWILQDLKPLIGIVSPDYDDFFITTYTVREIVASGLFSSLGFDFHHEVSPEVWEKADSVLEKNRLSYLRERMMNTLSAGEKRRVMLARAEITDPEILLLDEASNALDFPSRADLRATISRYATKGRTIIMVTHELAEIIPEVTRVILMKDGRIVFDGKKEEAITSERLSKLYSRDVEVAMHNGIYTAFC